MLVQMLCSPIAFIRSAKRPCGFLTRFDTTGDHVDLGEMGATVRVTRVGVDIQLEAVDLSFAGIDREGRRIGGDDPLRIPHCFLIHIRVDAHRQAAQSSGVLDTELEVASDLWFI